MGPRAEANYRLTASDASKTATDSFKKNMGGVEKAVDGVKSRIAGMVGLAGLGAIGSVAVSVGVAFNREMANVRSITNGTESDFARLTAAAREMGRTTAYSAQEAAKAQYALASSGMNTRQIIATLPNVLKIAAALADDLSHSTEMVTGTLNAFNLKATDSSRVVNVFAAAIKESPLNAQRLGDALAYAGPIAGTFNVQLEEAVATLGIFHTRNVMGSMAGTRFAATMLAMQKQIGNTDTEIGRLLKDWKPTEEGLVGGLRRLEAAGYDGEKALRELGAEGGAGLAVLLSAGSKAIEDLKGKITGTNQAQVAFETQMNTTWGDFKLLMGQVKDAAIEAWSGVEAAVRREIEAMTKTIADWRTNTIDKVIKSLQDMGAEIEDINRLTALKELQQTEESLKERTENARDAIKNLHDQLIFMDAGVRQVGKSLTSGTYAVARYGSSYNDLSAAMNQTTVIVDRDATQAVAEFTERVKTWESSLKQVNEEFGKVGINLDRTQGLIRELVAAPDPFDPKHLNEVARIMNRIRVATITLGLAYTKQEISAEVWERLTGKLNDYLTPLAAYKKALETIIDLEAEREALLAQYDTAVVVEAAKNQAPAAKAAKEVMEAPKVQMRVMTSSVTEGMEKLPAKELASDLTQLGGQWDEIINAMAETREEADLLGFALDSLRQGSEIAFGAFLDASIAALQGSKGAYAEMGKVVLKWAADTIKSLAVQAATKALFYAAEGLIFSIWGNSAAASAAFKAAALYAKVAAVAIPAAIGVGSISANNAPSGQFMSQRQREETTGLASQDEEGGASGTGGGTRITSEEIAQRPTTINITHIYYGPVNFGSQAQSDVAALQEVLDTNELSLGREVA